MGEQHFFVYRAIKVPALKFVEFWAEQYRYPEEKLYTDNIQSPHTCETLRNLFKWKIEPRFRTRHLRLVEKNFISRLEEARQRAPATDAADFLRLFSAGGAVYRIFWMHCWEPKRFPIYDQHVHRAMNFIVGEKHKELSKFQPEEVVKLYLSRYLPFWGSFADFDGRKVDKAMWAFG